MFLEITCRIKILALINISLIVYYCQICLVIDVFGSVAICVCCSGRIM